MEQGEAKTSAPPNLKSNSGYRYADDKAPKTVSIWLIMERATDFVFLKIKGSQ